MKTILVPVDFSDITGKVLDAAESMAVAFGSKVILVHVAEPEPDFVGYDPGPLSVRIAIAADIHSAQKRLDDLKQKFSGPDILALHVQGSIAEEILNLAAKHDASLIVIGSHGHGSLYHLLAGGVATAVLKRSPCPVLIVPTDHRPADAV